MESLLKEFQQEEYYDKRQKSHNQWGRPSEQIPIYGKFANIPGNGSIQPSYNGGPGQPIFKGAGGNPMAANS